MDVITLMPRIIIKQRYMNDGAFEIGNQIWKSGSEELNFNDQNK